MKRNLADIDTNLANETSNDGRPLSNKHQL